jgi:Arc/MetJ-type ribon-helix-helix transcriptional regulator
MATATMNISLPETMRAEIEAAVISEGYGSASELFRELARKYIKERQKRLEQAKLEALLVERLQEPEIEFDLQAVKTELAKRLHKGRQSKV